MQKKLYKRFYVDCTRTYFDRLNDGISRVTRNLLEHSDVILEMGSYDVHPIVFYKDKYYVFPSCDIFKSEAPKTHITTYHPSVNLLWLRNKLLSKISITKAKRKTYRQKLKPAVKHWPHNLDDIFANSVKLLEVASLSKSDCIIVPELLTEDQLILIDELRSKVSMAFIIHDMIPLTHPEYCGDTITYNILFKFAAKNADAIVAVSKYSEACFKAYEKLLTVGGESLNDKNISYCYLGSDLPLEDVQSEPTPKIKNIFLKDAPTFLVCGTIEPRKNHYLILNAFNKLWEQGFNVKLLFIGRYGWKVELTMQAIIQHPELNKRLFWIPQCTETDLNYAYQHCRALIFASQVEGFGLPLVEALAKSKEVFFSRIKVFEEILPEEFLINSFDPENPEELLNLILESLREKNRLNFDKFKPVSWRQRIREFYQILIDDGSIALQGAEAPDSK